ncbi:hypothetical protein L841_0453 [Mycobacterium sp. MAC_080597_8934]|nr:hypothetical protein L841_0453 [Mycobacterium sp. MAC_080597_8934]
MGHHVEINACSRGSSVLSKRELPTRDVDYLTHEHLFG